MRVIHLPIFLEHIHSPDMYLLSQAFYCDIISKAFKQADGSRSEHLVFVA